MGDLKKRITDLLGVLNGHREIGLNLYLDELEKYVPAEGSLTAINRAGMLADLDRHITNLEMELKRIDAVEHMGGQNA